MDVAGIQLLGLPRSLLLMLFQKRTSFVSTKTIHDRRTSTAFITYFKHIISFVQSLYRR